MNTVSSILILTKEEKEIAEHAIEFMMYSIANVLANVEILSDESREEFLDKFVVLVDAHQKLM